MTLKETRQFIGKQMKLMGDGEISIDLALTQSKLAGRIIDTYNTELRAVELSARLSGEQFNYQDALEHIERDNDFIETEVEEP